MDLIMESVLDTVYGVIEPPINDVINFLNDGIEFAEDAVDSVVEPVVDAANSAVGGIYDAIDSVAGGTVRTYNSGIQGVENLVNNVGNHRTHGQRFAGPSRFIGGMPFVDRPSHWIQEFHLKPFNNAKIRPSWSLAFALEETVHSLQCRMNVSPAPQPAWAPPASADGDDNGHNTILQFGNKGRSGTATTSACRTSASTPSPRRATMRSLTRARSTWTTCWPSTRPSLGTRTAPSRRRSWT